MQVSDEHRKFRMPLEETSKVFNVSEFKIFSHCTIFDHENRKQGSAETSKFLKMEIAHKTWYNFLKTQQVSEAAL